MSDKHLQGKLQHCAIKVAMLSPQIDVEDEVCGYETLPGFAYDRLFYYLEEYRPDTDLGLAMQLLRHLPNVSWSVHYDGRDGFHCQIDDRENNTIGEAESDSLNMAIIDAVCRATGYVF